MNILYLCHRIPYPPNKGEKIRAFHQLRALTERHEVDLVTLADDADDLRHKAALEKYCRSVFVAKLHRNWARIRILLDLTSARPLSFSYVRSAILAAHVRHLASRHTYDRIFVYCSAMGQYLKHCPRGVPVIMDLVDVDSDKWRQYAQFTHLPFSAVYRREAWALRRCERLLAEEATRALVSTEREAVLLRELSPAAKVEVIPNGVDTEHFNPAASPRQPGPPAVVFVGDMSYLPNQQAVVWFAQEALPLILRQVPGARLLVVGRNPGPTVRALARQATVEVTGSVSDVRTYLARAMVVVVPLFIASGIQNKILEAMACGLPVVASPKATQGLSSGARQLVQTGESASEFAGKVAALLRDPEGARSLGLRGRAQVTADYGWESTLQRLTSIVESGAGQGTQPADRKTCMESEVLPTDAQIVGGA